MFCVTQWNKIWENDGRSKPYRVCYTRVVFFCRATEEKAKCNVPLRLLFLLIISVIKLNCSKNKNFLRAIASFGGIKSDDSRKSLHCFKYYISNFNTFSKSEFIFWVLLNSSYSSNAFCLALSWLIFQFQSNIL